jgi:lipopolysaccharide transport system ATP-binding protein
MRGMLEQGTTLLYVSHSIDSVRAICDHALWLDHGIVKMSGDVNTVTNEYMKE